MNALMKYPAVYFSFANLCRLCAFTEMKVASWDCIELHETVNFVCAQAQKKKFIK